MLDPEGPRRKGLVIETLVTTKILGKIVEKAGDSWLVDDLLVVSAALSHLLNDVHPDIVRAAWPGQGDALDAIQRVSRWSEDQVGGRLRRALGISAR